MAAVRVAYDLINGLPFTKAGLFDGTSFLAIGSAIPNSIMECCSLVGQQRPYDLDTALAGRKNSPAGKVKCRVLAMIARETLQLALAQSKDNTADTDPVDRPGAHGAWLGGDVDRTTREERGIMGF
jgi:hypothetical protein